MFNLSVYVVCIMATCSIIQATLPLHGRIESGADRRNTAEIRIKRSRWFLVIMGKNAAKKLLQKAKQIGTGETHRLFEKPGGFRTAVTEFFSVNPTAVRRAFDLNRGTTLTGEVGDRVVSLQSNGVKGKPTLQIVNQKKANRQHTDTIIYND